ncbi:hypothetical protein [Anaplasma phagocytophilum]|uniref:hypothetical protein n=1 Tax=Anaplasma phagocytophilum TaxID=948 RepID=UPI00201A5A08
MTFNIYATTITSRIAQVFLEFCFHRVMQHPRVVIAFDGYRERCRLCCCMHGDILYLQLVLVVKLQNVDVVGANCNICVLHTESITLLSKVEGLSRTSFCKICR